MSSPAPGQSPLPDRFRSMRPELACAILLAVAVVVLRVLLMRRLSFCGTPDACYYLGMGRNLAAGKGFRSNFVYDFQQARPTLPGTGIEYWRPGISLLLLVLQPFGGVTLHSASTFTILVGLVYAAAAWHVARRSTDSRSADSRSNGGRSNGGRWLALGSFAFCLFCSSAWIGSTVPDSGLYYGAAVAWFLALFTVRRQGLVADAVALFCVAGAYLIRNDAALLLVPLLAVLWGRARSGAETAAATHPDPPRQNRFLSWPLLWPLAGFLLALAPMHLLYHHVLGTAFPSGTSKVLFIHDLSEFQHYNAPVSLATLLHHGWGALVALRVKTLLTVLYRFAALMLGYPALVFLPGLLPLARGERNGAAPDFCHLPEAAGPVSFALVSLVAYTLLLPGIGGFSALRTLGGLMPVVSCALMVAICRLARTPRLAAWSAALVIAATALTGLMEIRRYVPAGSMIGAADQAEANAIHEMGGDPARSIVMTNDPVQFSVTTSFPTVALPNNGLAAMAAAARDFHVTHIILDTGGLPAALPVLRSALHPVASTVLEEEHSLILELAPNASSR